MDRRSFLKQASAYALATTWTMTNLEQIFAATPPAKRNETREPGKSMEHRNLGGMEVSAIGLGCLPMVGYYGGKYDKKEVLHWGLSEASARFPQYRVNTPFGGENRKQKYFPHFRN